MPLRAKDDHLADFQERLKGTWANRELPGSDLGGENKPLSYCVMPLPQGDNYILKNFTLYETVKFNDMRDVALPATAPNRGVDVLQVPTALFYQQQVSFAQGPDRGKVVHVENGAWLTIATGDPQDGPYPKDFPMLHKPENPERRIAKQISVPHGNSILARGTFDDPASGSPTIPAVDSLPTPPGLDTTPYGQQSANPNYPDKYQNPRPDLTANVNLAIETALGIIEPTRYIHWHVDSGDPGSSHPYIVNIPFEERYADVVRYLADYWLLSKDGDTYPWLAYSQNIVMEITIPIDGGTTYKFPHTTSNVVTKVPAARA